MHTRPRSEAAKGISLNSIVEEAALYEEAVRYGVVACYAMLPPALKHSIMGLFREGWSRDVGGKLLAFVRALSCHNGRWIDSSPKLSEEETGLIDEIIRAESESGRRNYFPLILMHSVFCEVELQRLLLAPARAISGDLIEAQVAEKPSFNVTAMEAWSQGNIPGTLGITGMVVCALRWGLRQRRPAIKDWVQSQFVPAYQAIISNRALSQAIEVIRGNFRNPACHGEVIQYSKADYEHLAKLVVGTDSVAAWRRSNTGFSMNAGEAVLHNHLVLKRRENSDMETKVSSDGFARCPWCRTWFPVARKTAWDGARHVPCGAPLRLVST